MLEDIRDHYPASSLQPDALQRWSSQDCSPSAVAQLHRKSKLSLEQHQPRPAQPTRPRSSDSVCLGPAIKFGGFFMCQNLPTMDVLVLPESWQMLVDYIADFCQVVGLCLFSWYEAWTRGSPGSLGSPVRMNNTGKQSVKNWHPIILFGPTLLMPTENSTDMIEPIIIST